MINRRNILIVGLVALAWVMVAAPACASSCKLGTTYGGATGLYYEERLIKWWGYPSYPGRYLGWSTPGVEVIVVPRAPLLRDPLPRLLYDPSCSAYRLYNPLEWHRHQFYRSRWLQHEIHRSRIIRRWGW